MGRPETSLALDILMNEHHGDAAGAVEVTDGIGFDWLQWVANLSDAPELIRRGVRRVFVVRWLAGKDPELALCSDNGEYATIVPRSQRYTGGRRSAVLLYRNPPWQHEMMLADAPVAVRPWLQLREAGHS